MKRAGAFLLCAVLTGGTSVAGGAPSSSPPRQIGQLVASIQKSADRFRESLREAAKLEERSVRGRAGSLGDRLRDAARRLPSRGDTDNQAAGLVLAVLRSARDMHDFMDDHPLTDAARRDWGALVVHLNALADAFGEPRIDGVVIEGVGARHAVPPPFTTR